MRGLVVLVLAGLLIVPGGITEDVGAGEQYPDAIGPEQADPIDNDPRIYDYEVVEPMLESEDPAWEAPYAWHSGEVGPGKGLDSVQCGGRDLCEEFVQAEKQNETESGAAVK